MPHRLSVSGLALLPLVVATLAASRPVEQPAATDRLADCVVVVGLDGCRPEAIERSAGPVLRDLVKTGAWTWTAKAAHPTVTHVNFAGILTGCTPERHGIADKEWQAGGRPKVRVPTVFEVVAGAGLTAAGFLGHEKLYPCETDTKGAHFEHSPYGAKAAGPVVAKYLTEHRPDFCFVYMGDLDGAGHKYGWLSPEQLARMKDIDDGLAAVVRALKESGRWKRTLLIVTSDHGGHGKSHGGGTAEDETVPWVAAGPLAKPGQIRSPVRNMDTAATAAWALGVARPAVWDGRPIEEILTRK